MQVDQNLKRGDVKCTINGSDAETEERYQRLIVKGRESNGSLFEFGEDPTSVNNTEAVYPNGLRVTKENIEKGVRVTYRPKLATRETITIKVSLHTLVTVDSSPVDLWPV